MAAAGAPLGSLSSVGSGRLRGGWAAAAETGLAGPSAGRGAGLRVRGRGREGLGCSHPAPLHSKRTVHREVQVAGEPAPPHSLGVPKGTEAMLRAAERPGEREETRPRVARGKLLHQVMAPTGARYSSSASIRQETPNFLRGERRPLSWTYAVPRFQCVYQPSKTRSWGVRGRF